jgi:hypothetical protein
MKTSSRIALKEWAVVVRALREGRQLVLLRKGGIADDDGAFTLQEREFFLYPTYEHQSSVFLSGAAIADLEQSVRERPAGEKVLIDTYAEVKDAHVIKSEEELAPVLGHSIWATAYLQQRLRYKPEKPLLLVTLRVHRLAQPHLIDETPDYAGCVSWVPLTQALSTQPSTPALSDDAFAAAVKEIKISKQRTPR